ncbi:SUKH-4 family immunity protein [Streptomyces sp. NPDC047017]|uniref:SUKH-4 family immunity protein n=1 Tax=Streptomyces sp. NPDC047017 TaxID=3155024 RepID=UPI003411953C
MSTMSTAVITPPGTGRTGRTGPDPYGTPAPARLPHGGPGPRGPRRPLPPPLEALYRFAAVTEELAALRAQFTRYADRYGPRAVTGASRRLLAAFEEGADGGLPPFRAAAALIRPLSLAAGTGPGLALEIPARLLDAEFGPGRVARFEDVDFPATLTHEPTRRFLRETGLPTDGTHLRLDTDDTDTPLPTLAEHHADETAPALPAEAARWIRLGQVTGGGSLLLDGTTGRVGHWSGPGTPVHPLGTDVSTLAGTLWLLHRESASGTRPTTEAYDRPAMTMIQILASVDPTGTAPGTHWHYWTQMFQAGADAML